MKRERLKTEKKGYVLKATCLRREGNGAQAHEVELTLDKGGPPLPLGRSRSKEGMCVCRFNPFCRSGMGTSMFERLFSL